MSWRIPNDMWQGKACWIIGGGPSLNEIFEIPSDVVRGVISLKTPFSRIGDYLKVLHTRRVIGVNNAYRLGQWVPFVFFGDHPFFVGNEIGLAEFGGFVITCSEKVRDTVSRRDIFYVPKDLSKNKGITDDPQKVSWNVNSGAASISLAVNFGVTRIFLIGFDFINVDGNSHWHGYHHFRQSHPMYQTKFRVPKNYKRQIGGFGEIGKDAKRKGIEIYNLSQRSILPEEYFPKITLEQALEMDNV